MKRLYIIPFVLPLIFLGFFFSGKIVESDSQSSKTENNTSVDIPDYVRDAFDQDYTGFEENKGQFFNEEGKPVPEVLFKATTRSGDVYITNRGLSFVFTKYPAASKEDYHHHHESDGVSGATVKSEQEDEIEFCRLDMELKDASINVKGSSHIKKEHSLNQGSKNYFYPHCPEGIYGVKTYKKITIKSVYEKTDWVLYADPEEGLKYEFVLHPGADPDKIRLKYKWAKDIQVTNNSTRLNIQSPFGEVKERGIYSYEKMQNSSNDEQFRTIDTKYKVKKNEVSFILGKYNKNNTVVIDPPYELEWATYYGHTNTDDGFSIAADQVGNIYVAGRTQSTSFPTENPGGGAFFIGNRTGTTWDAFIVKFNNDCQQEWATYYGGKWEDFGLGIATDTASNVFVTGYTKSDTSFPTLNPGSGAYFVDTNSGGWDLFILKFDSNSVRQWATLYGGSSHEGSTSWIYNDIAADISGNIYVTGWTYSENFPKQDPGGGAYFDSSYAGMGDIFIVKFNNSGQRQWATLYGGDGYETGAGIAVNQTGNVFITGHTQSSDFPVMDPGSAYIDSSCSGTDAFILKFSDSGVRQWATCYGGSGTDQGHALAADQFGNVFVIGHTFSGNFPTYNPGVPAYYDGNYDSKDLFLLKFNSSCERQWATFYGGTDLDYPLLGRQRGIYVDDIGNIYLTYETHSDDVNTVDPGGSSYFHDALNGDEDIFILQFSSALIPQWSTYYEGSSNDEQGVGITMNSMGNLFILANALGDDLLTVNPGGAYFQEDYGGGSCDIALLKFGGNAVPVELADFNAVCRDNRFVEITWKTASEINNDYFTVEKSGDGINYAILTKVKGNGNSNSVSEYAVIDEEPFLNTTYYRLKQTDFDGTSQYNDIVNIQCNLPDNYLEITGIYPVPAKNSIYLTITSSGNSDVTIIINNSAGQKVAEHKCAVERGENQIEMDISDLAGDVYYMSIATLAGTSKIRKLVISK